jgi:malonate-semialdehyde dehydrogenase (acetylating)/methylmalonate-semialdehyde dehydrogenase
MSSAVTSQVTELQNYINGHWRRPSSAEFFDVTNPATTELLARTPMSSPADVDAAVQAAADAFPAWRRTPPGERVQYLFKLKNLLEEHIDELSRPSLSKMVRPLAKRKPNYAVASKMSKSPAASP